MRFLDTRHTFEVIWWALQYATLFIFLAYIHTCKLLIDVTSRTKSSYLPFHGEFLKVHVLAYVSFLMCE